MLESLPRSFVAEHTDVQELVEERETWGILCA
jgi:hypothetical protein